MRRSLCLIAWVVLLATSSASAQEVQQHGLQFETWVRNTFFDGYVPSKYTQKWDIPASANQRYGGIPVNPKAIKYGSAVDLGDALRQFDIAEPFILVVGFWLQSAGEKRFVNIVAPRITPDIWQQLWSPVTRRDLERLNAVIKDRTLTPAQARAAARKIKNSPPFTESIMVVNPKIDSKSQRRLQCSLRFDDLFKHLAPDADPTPQTQPALWGILPPPPLTSSPRRFSK
jgi:hypothetical protein